MLSTIAGFQMIYRQSLTVLSIIASCSLKEMLGQLDVRLIDHCIVGGNQVLSFAEKGLL
jgi:hypothetical protein